MRCAIIADIHANLAAFSTVLADIKQRGGVDEVWCLGDIVGYGPDPRQCIELLRRLKNPCIAGNHDWGAIGKLSLSEFNPDAAYACRWTAEQLSAEDAAYLEGLPRVIEKGDFTLVHGSPRQPIWEYLLSISSARENFAYFSSQFCLVGHSHVPSIFRRTETGDCSFNPFSANVGLALGKSRLIINPGGVGQPRDDDNNAKYIIWDSQKYAIEVRYVPYDIETVVSKIIAAGLPESHAYRLR